VPQEPPMPRLLTEFVGTFFLVLTVVLASPHAAALTPIAIGLILMVMVYMGGHISGAHYNPAVTLAVLVRGKIPFADAVGSWIVQFGASIVAAFVGSALNRVSLGSAGVAISPAPGLIAGADRSDLEIWLSAGLVEVLFAFALALVVLNVTTTRATAGNSYFG